MISIPYPVIGDLNMLIVSLAEEYPLPHDTKVHLNVNLYFWRYVCTGIYISK